MKKIKNGNKKSIVGDVLITIVIVAVVLAIAILLFVSMKYEKTEWVKEFLDAICTITGLLATVFSFWAWNSIRIMKKRRNLDNLGVDPTKKGKMALLIALGEGMDDTYPKMRDYFKDKRNNKNGEYNEILEGRIPFVEGGKVVPQRLNEENMQIEDISEIVLKGTELGSFFSIEICRDLEGNGKYIGIQTGNWASNEEGFARQTMMLQEVMELISNYLNKLGANELHIFYGRPSVLPFVIQDVLANRFTEYIYHYGNGYMRIAKLEKGQK